MKKILLILIIMCVGMFTTACTSKIPQNIKDNLKKIPGMDKVINLVKTNKFSFKMPVIDFEKDLYKKIEKRGTVRIGVKKDTKPFGYVNPETNELEGFDIDLAKKITQMIFGANQKIEFVEVTPSTRIEMVCTGEIDMIIATMTMTSLRMEILDFSEPYYIAGQVLMVKSGSKVKSISDLIDKKVGIVYGSTAEKNLKRIAPYTVLLGYKTYPEAYDALLNQQVEALLSDDTILMGFAMGNPSVKLLHKRYSSEPYAIAFAKSEHSLTLKDKVNFAIDTMNKNDELNDLRKKWIKVN